MKSVTLYRPVSIDRAVNDLDRYMESFFGESLFGPAAGSFGRLPAMDIRETGDSYAAELELPGFDEKNIEVHVDGKTVIIQSKQEEATEEKRDNFILKERRSSSFSRSFSFPENADYGTIGARFKNGILTLEVKKLPEAKKRTIEIESN